MSTVGRYERSACKNVSSSGEDDAKAKQAGWVAAAGQSFSPFAPR